MKRVLIIGIAVLVLIAAAATYQTAVSAWVSAPTGVTLTGWATDTQPLEGGVGVLRNDGPLDVQIVGVRPVGADAAISLTAGGNAPGAPFLEGDKYTLPAHSEAFVWLSMTTSGGEPTGFTEIEVDYLGPLGLGYTAIGTGVGMLAYSQSLPTGVASLDDSTESLSSYLQAIFEASAADDAGRMAIILGNSASSDDAAAFMAAQPGLSDAMGYTSQQSGHTTTIAFFETSSEHSLPAFSIEWSHHRWQVVL